MTRPAPARCPAGYTMLELVVVMVLVAVLAATAMPSFTAAVGMRDQAWHDAALSAVRLARATAMSHRRVVCLTFSANTVSLAIATANPAVNCNASLVGPDGTATFASSANSSATTVVQQGGVAYNSAIYFQPDGRVTTDLSGGNVGQWTIAMTGATTVVLEGITGYAR